LSCINYNVNRINIYGIIINVNSSLYITSDRNEVTAADNPTNDDTYEDIAGATNNQKKKGSLYNLRTHFVLNKSPVMYTFKGCVR
jgi:hypothetical protein